MAKKYIHVNPNTRLELTKNTVQMNRYNNPNKVKTNTYFEVKINGDSVVRYGGNEKPIILWC